ncbi:MAG: hypothetical protein A3E82_02320 [Gammaproteobacteria bacterium RIFCSPHIGHO2_12_FULL_38_11]|nr:MAG: hypothetical protein A3E82_02320 [Gammaproteobacteria bacterium RIFCSPHIGHO2_12_FULL_38_11]
MPRNINESEFTAILAALAAYKEATADQLNARLSVPLNSRTLKRRLASLVAQKKLMYWVLDVIGVINL